MRQQAEEMASTELRIRVLIFRDPSVDAWVAQGLEHDICAQAKTIDDLYPAFEQTVVANIAIALERGEAPFKGIPKAPNTFFEAFRQATLNVDIARPKRPRGDGKRRGPSLCKFHPVFRVTDRLATLAA